MAATLQHAATVHDGIDWYRWVNSFNLVESLEAIHADWGKSEFAAFQATLRSKTSACDLARLLAQTSNFVPPCDARFNAKYGIPPGNYTKQCRPAALQKYADAGFRAGIAVFFATYFGLRGENWPAARYVQESDTVQEVLSVIPFTLQHAAATAATPVLSLTNYELQQIRFGQDGLRSFVEGRDWNVPVGKDADQLRGTFRHFFYAAVLHVLSAIVFPLLIAFVSQVCAEGEGTAAAMTTSSCEANGMNVTV
jgi:hypothetical protein